MKLSWMMRWLAVVAFSPITLFLLWLGYQGTRGNVVSTQEMVAHQRSVKQHWFDLGQRVVLTRQDALPSYDAVSQSARELGDDIARLQTDAMGLDSPALHVAVDRVAELKTGQIQILETFKTTNALLKNSLRYLPTASTELANALRAAGRIDLARAVEDLSREVLIFNLTANPELRDSVQAAAAALTQTLSLTRWHEDGDLLIKHIGMILDNKVRLDTQMGALLDSPMPIALEDVAQRLQQIQRAEAVRQNQYLTAMSVYAVILLGLVVYFSIGLKRRTDDLRQQATHDSLTGLGNRAQLHVEMQKLIQSVEQNGKGFSLMLMDLDRFKEINDTLGHQSGDSVLKEVAPRLRESLPAGCFIARLGGDEFAIVMPESEVETALGYAQILREALKPPFILGGLSVEISASLGVAHFPENGSDSSELLRRADIAMYVAKQGGGCQLYESQMDFHSPRRLTLMNGLAKAIDEGQLVLFYQPKVDLRSGSVKCVEALLRWNHPVLGMVPPDEFIPLAEVSEVIHPLTRWVIRNAARQLKLWEHDGLMLDVAINLSARNLMDETLPQSVQRILDAEGVAPSRIRMEITESAIMSDPQRAQLVLDRIEQMGIKLSIDDFGTGYSSLAYLLRLPVDELKLDRTFVANLDKEGGEAAIVLSTSQMAHNLGLSVTAEGAEDAATVSKLIQANYDMVQGYYFCKPLPAESLKEWIASGKLTPLLEAARPSVVLMSVDNTAAKAIRAVI